MVVKNQRIMRSYRYMPPGRFYPFNQRVRKSLADTSRIPEWIWVSNPTLLASYFAVSDKHDPVHHEAMLGSKPLIAEREMLQAQIIEYLDQIAAILEAAALRNPEILLVCGFDLGKERRSHPRTTAAHVDVNAANAAHEGGGTDNVGT